MDTPCGNPNCQHCAREAQHAEWLREVCNALANVLAVENKNWPNYVRQEFAAARAVLARATQGRDA